jgi:hypothetical protein
MTILNDALHAYLTPLLQKHAAGQAVIYDDLIHAWQATEGILKTDFDPTVSVRTLLSLFEFYECFAQSCILHRNK